MMKFNSVDIELALMVWMSMTNSIFKMIIQEEFSFPFIFNFTIIIVLGGSIWIKNLIRKSVCPRIWWSKMWMTFSTESVLCLTSVKEQPKRLSIDKPLFAFIMIFIFMIERVVTCTRSEDNEVVFRILASTGHFLGIRVYFDLYFILCSILSMMSQVINYWNYKQRVDPTFLRLFRMMSGAIPPKALGLTDSKLVVRLCRQSAKWFKFLKRHNDYLMTSVGPGFVLPFYYYQTSFIEILIFGIPNAIHFTLWVRFYWNFFFYQFLVFYFLCYYLKIKIKILNNTAKEMTRNQNLVRIPELIRSYHSIAKEIQEYNGTYWSKFLLNFWLTYGLTMLLMLYINLFIPMQSLITRYILFHVLNATVTSFLILILKASSVNYAAKLSHVTLSSLFVNYSRHNTHPKRSRLFIKSKVRIPKSLKIFYLMIFTT